MNQTNRKDAAQRYLEAVGFTKSKPFVKREGLPRVRFVNNLGCFRLTDERGWVVFANDIESAYYDWLDIYAERNDLSDLPAFDHAPTMDIPWRILGWSAFLILAIAIASFICFAFR